MEILDKIVVTDIVDIFTVFSPKGKYEIIDNRKNYGLSFCDSGQITYVHKGANYVSAQPHAMILPPGETYELYGDKSGVFTIINFECKDFLCDAHMVLPVENIDFIMKNFFQMKNLSLFDGNKAKVMSIFYDIIHNLSVTSNSQYGVLYPALKYLESNYSTADLNNRILAEQCEISEVYFRKLFVERYGVSPHQYVINIRMNKAKQLLADGILKINAISEECGFSNPYHFCRLFKEKTGMTPTEYMKKHKIIKI